MAASATFALKAVVPCPLSGRNSTYRPVQISGTSSDITYIRTWAGFLYLAVVLHAFSCRPPPACARWLPSTIRRSGGSANNVGRRVSAPRWGRSEMLTTRLRKAYSPRSNTSPLDPRRPGRSAHGRVLIHRGLFTIRASGTHRSKICTLIPRPTSPRNPLS